MPRMRRGGPKELVGLYVFGDGKAAEEVLGQVLRVFGVRLNMSKKRRKNRRFFVEAILRLHILWLFCAFC